MKTFKIDDERKIGPGFKVPNNYFETLPEKINVRMGNAEIKVIPLENRRKSWTFAIAAVLVLALSIPVLNTMKPAVQQTEIQAIENYLAYSEIPDDQLVELLEDEDIEKLEFNYNLEDKAVEDVLSNSVNLEQYIID